MDRFRTFVCLITLSLTLAGLPDSVGDAGAGEPGFTEYEVKAGFIYNVAKFVEWPEGSGLSSKGTITLCVLGNDPFGKVLDNIEGKMVKGKRLEIRRVSSLRELKDCQIAFISASEKEHLSRIADALREASVLTIGDTEGFISQGVIINFFMEGKKVRFEIDPERAKRSKLTISSQLLKLAKIAGEKQ